MKKLPLWGNQCTPDKINFEWPSQGLFDFMEPDVSLTSLSLKMQDSSAISSIQCVLSNGEISPVFENECFKGHKHQQTISFESFGQITAVSAHDSNGNWHCCTRLRFFNSESQVCEYNPFNRGEMGTEHYLAENEELIGVYGQKDTHNYIDSLGFIVKVKQLK